jgi:GTPase
MKFYDEAKIEIHSGKGGSGCMSFHREKYVPKGGPDGGDGGDGGSVIVEASTRRQNLIDFHYQRVQKADNGRPGEGSQRHGKNGEDLLILLPVGTVIYDAETGEQIGDLVEEGQRQVLAKGGKGGKGNEFFKSSVNRAPRKYQPGLPGEDLIVRFELKLLADVGLVGFPNAGKSTLISVISEAKPKIADYPFTTLIPNLGVVRLGDFQSFVVADIPGLIEGASQGAGLGHQFLRHIERTRIIWHILDLSDYTGRDTYDDYEKICNELATFSPKLMEKRQLVVANKMDLTEADEKMHVLKEKFEKAGIEFFAVSAVSRFGLKPLLYRTMALLEEDRDSK